MHKLLLRQLKRYAKNDEQLTNKLLQAISDTYDDHQMEMELLERTLHLTSTELNERNRDLSSQLETIKRTKAELQQSAATMTATLNATGEVILVFDEQDQLVSFNKMSESFFHEHLDSEPQHIQSLRSTLVRPAQLDDLTKEIEQAPESLLVGHFEFCNGQYFAFRTMPTRQDDRVVGRVWCLRDVSQQREYEITIQHQAYHDALTGLPNRLLLVDRIEHATSIARRTNSGLALLFIDLDNFKKVNDTEGHAAGDMLLIMLVERFKSRLREHDTLARLGGDEFIILLEDVHSKESVETLCKSLQQVVSEPFEINKRKYFVSTSIGISIFPSDDQNAEALIRKADMAMYKAKDRGKNNFQFYSKKLEYKALQDVEMEQKLRYAIETLQLSVYFQPKVDLQTSKVVAAEALIRWFREDGSVVPPNEFIPIAEQTGLVLEISKFVLNKCCEQLRDYKRLGMTDVKLAVNFSSIEFQDKYVVNTVKRALNRYQVDGNNLVIEVTESLFMEDKLHVLEIMSELKEIGVSFALDDFGKGYSSFSYLQTLPIDYLKIDKAFLQNVITSRQSSAITRTIIDVGHNLELKIIAEGIETQEVLDYVKKQGCTQAQGFYLYRPMSVDDFKQLLIEQHNTPQLAVK